MCRVLCDKINARSARFLINLHHNEKLWFVENRRRPGYSVSLIADPVPISINEVASTDGQP
jgi:hypothetical protein